jgi:hypothetical protein
MSDSSQGVHGMSRELPENLVARHGFLMLGTKNLYLCHLPMYSMAAHVFQTILEAEIETSEMEKYLRLKNENPSRPIIVLNETEMSLEKLASSKSFFGDISFSNENGDPIKGGLIGRTDVKVKKILLFKQLNNDSPDYPEHLEYYLFGTNSDWHLSHLLSKAPNFEQELDITISGSQPDNKESEIFKVSIPSVDERSKQPINKGRDKNKKLIMEDPLTRSDYEIVTEKGDRFQVSIINRFMINNTMLN